MKNIKSDHKVKAILIDSGRVLNGPSTGHWFITPNFFNYVDEKKYKAIGLKHRKTAFDKAGNYIAKQNLIKNEEDEFAHFLQYYRILFSELSMLMVNDTHIEAVARDLVYNYKKYSFYTDAVKIIPELSKYYKLAVVSDAWPSLENVFKTAGLRNYFSSFVVSSIKGVIKPDELMYRTALEELNIVPEEAIFIDDSIKNCDGASRLGIESFVLSREWGTYLYNKLTCRNHAVIRNLHELKKHLGGL